MRWMMCIGFVTMMAGCDASKPELDSTKATLASVGSERDQLKAQVTTLQQQLDATKAELAKAKTAPAAPGSEAKHATAPAAKVKPAHKS